MTLSKSDYMLYLRHPAWLWLKKRDKDKLPPVAADTQAMFDTGNLFEDYAEELFPDAVRLGRDSIGIEINKAYVTLGKKRLSGFK